MVVGGCRKRREGESVWVQGRDGRGRGRGRGGRESHLPLSNDTGRFPQVEVGDNLTTRNIWGGRENSGQ